MKQTTELINELTQTHNLDSTELYERAAVLEKFHKYLVGLSSRICLDAIMGDLKTREDVPAGYDLVETVEADIEAFQDKIFALCKFVEKEVKLLEESSDEAVEEECHEEAHQRELRSYYNQTRGVK